MNKKILSITLTLAVVLLATPLVSAVPLQEKNNDKFQTFDVTLQFSFMKIITADRQYVPSTEKANNVVISLNETMLKYDVTIDGKTYKLGTDFTYTGHVEYVFWDVTNWLVIQPFGNVWPLEYRQLFAKVNYMLDFSAVPGGIEGTLNLQAVDNKGGLYINSLAGTGDLQNVQVKAMIMGSTTVAGVITITHEGFVSGWPE